MKEIFYRREWLNRPRFHGRAYVYANVERHTRDEDRWNGVHGTLCVADCSHQIRLDFDVADDEDDSARDNAIHKIRLLHEVVGELCIALEKAYADQPRAQ